MRIVNVRRCMHQADSLERLLAGQYLEAWSLWLRCLTDPNAIIQEGHVAGPCIAQGTSAQQTAERWVYVMRCDVMKSHAITSTSIVEFKSRSLFQDGMRRGYWKHSKAPLPSISYLIGVQLNASNSATYIVHFCAHVWRTSIFEVQ